MDFARRDIHIYTHIYISMRSWLFACAGGERGTAGLQMHTVIDAPLTADSRGRISCRPMGRDPIEFSWTGPGQADVRTDATMRAAELAFRQAFSHMLDYPLRKLNVRLEAEPNQDCPHNFDNAVCRNVDCGYGQCVPSDNGNDYECLCNNCFLQQIENGKKSCVKDPLCFFKNPCLENPCDCGGQCTPCPECSGKKI